MFKIISKNINYGGINMGNPMEILQKQIDAQTKEVKELKDKIKGISKDVRKKKSIIKELDKLMKKEGTISVELKEE